MILLMLLLLPRAIATSNLALSPSSSSWNHNYCPSSSAARQLLFDVHAAATKSASSDIIKSETPYRFGVKLRKHAIFSRRLGRRRHNGLPRTNTVNRNNIKQQFILLLSKLGCESCIVTILLFILHSFVSSFITTLSLQQQSLCKFITTNLTRWVTVSVFIKLLTLHSQITTITTELSTTTIATSYSSDYLDDDWFLKGQFYVVPRKDDLAVLDCADDDVGDAGTHNKTAYISVRIRQVANDGSCLFHSIGARILSDELIMMQQERRHDRNDPHVLKRHPPMSRIIEYSSKLRLQAVNTLQYNPHQNFTILQYLYGDDDTEQQVVVEATSSSLISLAATQYVITQEEYLTSLKDENVWGGGPEIAALASALQREIVLLETMTTARTRSIGSYSATTNENDDNVHFLKVRARFRGDYDDSNNNAIYLLCTNQRYPKRYGRKGLVENHFLAVFPSTLF
jgi:hypothetical protein